MNAKNEQTKAPAKDDSKAADEIAARVKAIEDREREVERREKAAAAEANKVAEDRNRLEREEREAADQRKLQEAEAEQRARDEANRLQASNKERLAPVDDGVQVTGRAMRRPLASERGGVRPRPEVNKGEYVEDKHVIAVRKSYVGDELLSEGQRSRVRYTGHLGRNLRVADE